MSNFYLMHVKTAFQGFNKNGVYWVDSVNASKVPPRYATFYPSSLIKRFNCIVHDNLLLVRSGGIGDIIALSSLTDIVANITILTQDKYKPLKQYFAYQETTFKAFEEPIFYVKFPNTVENECKRWGQMDGDMSIEKGNRRNWYEVLNESVNFNFTEKYGRPRITSLHDTIQDGTCIIVSQASCINRTADKQMLSNIASKYFTKVVQADEQQWTFKEYLKQLDQARFVISTDTSAIHFREGVGKPALGIYGAFTTQSRTQYYIHTHSFNTKSSCSIQPCFYHDNNICPHITADNKQVPCLSNEIAEQVERELSTYLRKINIERMGGISE